MTNSAVLNIIGGGDPSFFSMGFGTRNSSAASWCVDKRCIEELIAELLYIRDDMIQAE